MTRRNTKDLPRYKPDIPGNNSENDKLTCREVYVYGDLSAAEVLNQNNWPELKKKMGGKGLSLAIMTALELNVPPGFTLPTHHGEALYEGGYQELSPELIKIINETIFSLEDGEAKFGDKKNPLAVAVRSGAAKSMPGAMDSILNVGFNKETITAFAEKMGVDEAHECYHVFCFGWAASQLSVSRNQLEQLIEEAVHGQVFEGEKTAAEYIEEIYSLEEFLAENYDLSIPDSTEKQLHSSILAVYRSYHSPDAIKYRHRMGISEEISATAVNVMSMVYGNQGEKSGSGVVFSHDPKTGEDKPQLEYADFGIGEAVVGGAGNGFQQELETELQSELLSAITMLEDLDGKPVDVEFVVEDGEMYFVQYRSLRLALPAKLKRTMEFLTQECQGLPIDDHMMLLRQSLDAQMLSGLGERFTDEAINLSHENENSEEIPRLIAQGQPIGGRAQVGKVATTLAEAEQVLSSGENVVLELNKLENANKILHLNERFPANQIAVITQEGSPSSHAAYVIGTENMAGVIGCRDSRIDDLKPGDWISVDGSRGEVHFGRLSLTEYFLDQETRNLIMLRKLMGASAWESIVLKLGLKEKLYEMENKIDQITWDYFQSKGFRSPKALTQEIINNVFPPEFLTEYHILSVVEDSDEEDENKLPYQQEIFEKVHAGWSKGFDVSVRSAFLFGMDDSKDKLGSNPWIMLKPGEDDRLHKFLYEELPDWKYGSLSAWKRQEVEGEDGTKEVELTEVLVGYNHSGKLDEDLADRYAAGVIDTTLGSKNMVSGSVNLDTPHLRSYEEDHYDPDQAITYKINFNQGEPRVILGFGLNHINQDAVAELADRLVKKTSQKESRNLSPEERAVRRDLLERLVINELDQVHIADIDSKELYNELINIIEAGDLPTMLLEQVVVDRSWDRATELMNKLVEEYIRAIAPGLAAVENWLSSKTGDFSEVTIEFQAGFEGDSLDDGWMAVYGIKGFEEALLSLQTRLSKEE